MTKKKKSLETIQKEIVEKSVQLSGIVAGYKASLQEELQVAEAEPEPYDSLLWALNRQIENLDNLENQLDKDLLPLVHSMKD
jgi:hypothetical protein